MASVLVRKLRTNHVKKNQNTDSGRGEAKSSPYGFCYAFYSFKTAAKIRAPTHPSLSLRSISCLCGQGFFCVLNNIKRTSRKIQEPNNESEWGKREERVRRASSTEVTNSPVTESRPNRPVNGRRAVCVTSRKTGGLGKGASRRTLLGELSPQRDETP